jgi:hypothetical protein
MQVLKQRSARQFLQAWRQRQDQAQRSLCDETLEEGQVWQRRFYDFVVWSADKRVEKLNYIHQNPVKRGSVLEPEQRAWSSSRHYTYDERGVVLVNEPQPAKLTVPSGTGMIGQDKLAG